MLRRSRKILIRVVVSGLALWVGRDAVVSTPVHQLDGPASTIAERIALALGQLHHTKPSSGFDGDRKDRADSDIVVTSSKRSTLTAGFVSNGTVRQSLPDTLLSRSVQIDLRGRRCFLSPPLRAPPAA